MNINSTKTKEMILGPFGKKSPTPLLIAAKPVPRVSEYKFEADISIFGRHRQLDDEVG